MKKNVASQVVSAVVVSATDGSAITSGVSVTVTGDGGTQGAGGGTTTHEGGGEWSYVPTQAETNFDHIMFKFSGTGAIPVGIQVDTQFPQTGDSFARLGAPAGASVSADVAAVQADTDNIQTRIPAALVSGRMDSSVGAMASGVVTATAVAASALNGKGDWNIGKTGYSLSAAGIQAIWDALTSALTTVGSIGKLLVDNINATISSRSTYAGADTAGTTTLLSRLTATRAGNLDNLDATVSSRSTFAGGAVASVTGNVGGNVVGSVGSIGAGGIPASAFGAGAIDAAAISTDAGQEIADAILDRNMASGTDSGSPTIRTVRQALRMLRNKTGIASGTLTVTKEDDTTASWTATVTTAAGNPISEVDPA